MTERTADPATALVLQHARYYRDGRPGDADTDPDGFAAALVREANGLPALTC